MSIKYMFMFSPQTSQHISSLPWIEAIFNLQHSLTLYRPTFSGHRHPACLARGFPLSVHDRAPVPKGYVLSIKVPIRLCYVLAYSYGSCCGPRSPIMAAAQHILFARDHFLKHQLIPLDQPAINSLDRAEQWCVICKTREFSVDGKRILQGRILFNTADLNDHSSFEIPVRLPCGHVFGKRCIVEYFSIPNYEGSYKNNCPMCRLKLCKPAFFKPATSATNRLATIKRQSVKGPVICITVFILCVLPLLISTSTYRYDQCTTTNPRITSLNHAITDTLSTQQDTLHRTITALNSYHATLELSYLNSLPTTRCRKLPLPPFPDRLQASTTHLLHTLHHATTNLSSTLPPLRRTAATVNATLPTTICTRRRNLLSLLLRPAPLKRARPEAQVCALLASASTVLRDATATRAKVKTALSALYWGPESRIAAGAGVLVPAELWEIVSAVDGGMGDEDAAAGMVGFAKGWGCGVDVVRDRGS